MAMDVDALVKGMVLELGDILVNSSSIASEDDMPNASMRRALSEFKKGHKPKYNSNVTIGAVERFVDKYKMFRIVESYFLEFERLGTRIIIIEGADGTGKTKLSEKIASRLHGVAIENQASALFRRMFKLPKIYKVAVADYNSNLLVGFLFYLVVNMVGLHEALKCARRGKKNIMLDSSFLRTYASHLAHPSDLKRKNSRIKINTELSRLIKRKLNSRYLALLKEARHSLFLVFLYASERARRMQVSSRYKDSETNDYDTNKRYARIIAGAIRKDEMAVKREGIPALSILMLEKGEKAGKGKADIIFFRTKNTDEDTEGKAKIVIERAYD